MTSVHNNENSTPKRPHFVTIVADDWGYFDRGSAGNKNVSTPRIDEFFSSGVTLQRYYGYKYCSPSRRSFVTGRIPIHLGEANQLEDGIDLRMTTLAEKLYPAGYKSILIGKTHWGVATTRHLPFYRGWYEHIGYLGGGEAYSSGHECVDERCNCDTYSSQLDFWHNDKPAQRNLIGHYSTTLYTDLAVDIIHNFSTTFTPTSERLWLHLNYQAVHQPQTSPPGTPLHDNNTDLVFYEVLTAMDSGIGAVMDALKSTKIWNDCLIILVSDNGAAVGNNFPLRGGKYKPFEGGVRLSAAISGGVLPSSLVGSNFKGMVHVSDFYPTFCGLAGVDPSDSPPKDASPKEWFWPVDGHDIWSYLTGINETNPREGAPLVISSPYTSGPGGGAMIIDNFKLVVNAHNDGWDQPCLYDLNLDLGEVHNLASSMPEKLKEMNATYTELVYNMRQVVPLNFTEDNGWVCDGKEGYNEIQADILDIETDCQCKSRPSPQCYRGHGHTIKIFRNISTVIGCCEACSQEPSCSTYSLESKNGEEMCFLLEDGVRIADALLIIVAIVQIFDSCCPNMTSREKSSSTPYNGIDIATALGLALAAGCGLYFYTSLSYRRNLVLFPPERRKQLRGRIFLITGSNSGIGLAAAGEIAARGGTVLLGSRTLEKAKAAKCDILSRFSNDDEARNVEPRVLPVCIGLNLESKPSVEAFAKEVAGMTSKLHVLINNAGEVIGSEKQGIEMSWSKPCNLTMSANYLGPALLTKRLLPLLEQSSKEFGEPSRIVNVSSRLEKNGKILSWMENPEKRDPRGPMSEYSTSKQAQICHVMSLADSYHHNTIGAYVVTPGMVNTKLGRYHWLFALSAPIRYLLLPTPEHGAKSVVFASIDRSLDGTSGAYFGAKDQK
eukprot:UC4_evm2s271